METRVSLRYFVSYCSLKVRLILFLNSQILIKVRVKFVRNIYLDNSKTKVIVETKHHRKSVVIKKCKRYIKIAVHIVMDLFVT